MPSISTIFPTTQPLVTGPLDLLRRWGWSPPFLLCFGGGYIRTPAPLFINCRCFAPGSGGRGWSRLPPSPYVSEGGGSGPTPPLLAGHQCLPPPQPREPSPGICVLFAQIIFWLMVSFCMATLTNHAATPSSFSLLSYS